MRKRSHRKVISTNSYRKVKKRKELEYETFDQVIENLLLSGTIFPKTDPDSFYISNGDIIIESFNDITLLRQDINEKENKIRDLNHRLEILSEVSALKRNDINKLLAFIVLSLTSPHLIKLSTKDIDEIKILREELKNKSTVINILLENTFSNNNNFSFYKSWKTIIK